MRTQARNHAERRDSPGLVVANLVSVLPVGEPESVCHTHFDWFVDLKTEKNPSLRLLALLATLILAVFAGSGVAQADSSSTQPPPAAPATTAPATSSQDVGTRATPVACVGLCVQLNQAETKTVADSPISQVGGMVSSFCGVIPPPGSVGCAVLIGYNVLEVSEAAKEASATNQCMTIRYIPVAHVVTAFPEKCVN